MLLVGDSSLICPHSPPTCHGVKNHTTRTVPINARRVDLLTHKRGKKVTNRCRSALVQSVLSSLVLVQGARARALWRLSGHTLLSREMRESR